MDGELSPDAYISGAFLRFNQVQRADSGDYQCIARNQYGDDTSVLRVYVRESNPEPTPSPPRPLPPNRGMTISPPNFSGRPGEVLVLTCRNILNVYPTLTWTKHGSPRLPTYVDVRNGVLTIQSVKVEDSGQYICTGTKNRVRCQRHLLILCFVHAIFFEQIHPHQTVQAIQQLKWLTLLSIQMMVIANHQKLNHSMSYTQLSKVLISH